MQSFPRNVAAWLFALGCLVGWVCLVGLGCLVGLERPALAAAPAPGEVPPELETWVPWVRAELGDAVCTKIGSEARCVWPGTLELELESNGGRFEQKLTVEAKALHRLPGGAGAWPLQVRVNGKAHPVVTSQGAPAVELSPGRYEVTGRFEWSALPETLEVGPIAALIELSVAKKPVPLVRRERGKVWLKGLLAAEGLPGESDETTLTVFRQIRDGVPLLVETRLSFQVSGRARELSLPAPGLPGTRALSVEGDLALSLEKSGTLRVQLVPGAHTITLLSRTLGMAEELSRGKQGAPWPEQEVWTWKPDASLRAVEVSGAPGVDPSRTDLPEEWRSDASFLVGSADVLHLRTTRRGQEQLAPNRIDVAREIWLDEAASAFTVRDQLSGTLHQGFRLDLRSGALGQARIAGEDQVITESPGGQGSGVEVRDTEFSLEAVSRLPRTAELSAVGWSEDANSLSWTLHLPPGWDVLWASGVDEVPDTWISRWDLFDVFFVLLLTVGVWRLTGPFGGVSVLLALVFSHGEDGAPIYGWVVLLVLSALVALVGQPRFRRALVTGFWVTFLIILVQLIAFSVAQVRYALYPHLFMESESSLFETAEFAAKQVTAPAEAPAPEQELDQAAPSGRADGESADAGNKEGGTGARSKARFLREETASYSSQRSALRQAPVDAIVQTGPGIPDAVARTFQLSWSGPVVLDHRVSLHFLSPVAMRVLVVLRLLAYGALVYFLFQSLKTPGFGVPLGTSTFKPVTEHPRRNRRRGEGGSASFANLWLLGLALTSALLLPARAAAEPSDARLAELKQRLLRPPLCAPDCVTATSLDVLGDGDGLILEAEVHAAASAAYRLPGPATTLGRAQVSVDGKPSSELRLEADGAYHLRLDAGVHRVRIEARLPSDRVTLDVGTVPRRVRVRTTSWLVSGVSDDGTVQGGTLVLQREAPKKMAGATPTGPGSEGDGSEAHVAVVPFFRVERHLELGITGRITTKIQRLSDASSPEVLSFRLLPGEHVTTPGVEVKGGIAQVTFPREMADQELVSSLDLGGPSLSLTLEAPPLDLHTQTWRVECGIVWHCDLSGLAPTALSEGGTQRAVFHPWPGEKLELRASWPPPASGQSLTVEGATLELSPGVRLSRGTLSLRVRTSRSVTHQVGLPPGARLEEVSVDDIPQAARVAGDRVDIALAPGSHRVLLRWHDPRGLTALFRTPSLSVGAPGTNLRVQVTLPAGRWLLFAGGPQQGPAILFWGYLVLIAVAAFVLARLPGSPLRHYQWFLLGLGLTQVPVGVAVFVAGWFFAVTSRRKWAHVTTVAKDIGQILLLVYTFAFLFALTAAVYQGLVSSPDMEVTGAGSHSGLLSWYVDRSAGKFPSAFVYSVSIWIWRAFMLVWSLWLARSLLGWLKLGWSIAGEGGFWAPSRPKRVPPFLGTPAPAAAAPITPAPGVAEPQPSEPGSTGAPAEAESISSPLGSAGDGPEAEGAPDDEKS